MEPMISICMPVYNMSGFLEHAFGCIGAQTFRDFEVVMVDDGSTDDSAQRAQALLQRYQLKGQVIRSLNCGAEQARDVACRNAQADVIATFDADDSWEPTYLEEMYRVLRQNPEVELVYCDLIEVFGETGKVALKSVEATWIDLTRAENVDGTVFVFDKGKFFPLLLQGMVLFPPCTMFRRDLYRRVGGYVNGRPDLKVSLDWGFGLRCARHDSIAFLNEPLLRKLVHGGNVSGNTYRTLSCSIEVLKPFLRDRCLTRTERQLVRHGLARRLREMAYDAWHTYRMRGKAIWLSVSSLRYAWSTRAVRIAVIALVPWWLVNRLR